MPMPSRTMLKAIGVGSLDELADKALPAGILDALVRPTASRRAWISCCLPLASRKRWPNCAPWPTPNTVAVSMIGQGYFDTLMATGVARNILENPGLVHRLHRRISRRSARAPRGAAELPDDGRRPDLGLEVANASMLDEGTAAPRR
jgi:glycine dehydrogenase